MFLHHMSTYSNLEGGVQKIHFFCTGLGMFDLHVHV